MIDLYRVFIFLAEIVYLVCSLATLIFGLNYLLLTILYLVHRKEVWERPTPEMSGEWPLVTIQLPIHNEGNMVERLLASMTGLEYPAGRCQIQVLDDSTDETSTILEKLVNQYRLAGVNIEYIHRQVRNGFKAGNLNHGLETATGELVAIFDADFEAPADWLLKVVPFFQDPRLGMVQTRFTNRNTRRNLLTRMAALVLDAQMIVEYSAFAGANLVVNFFGSAGMWRKQAILEHGGWQTYTLTEDIDMSMSTQLAGWKGLYLPAVVCQAEVPEEMGAFILQQIRWSRGHAQVWKKLNHKILTFDRPFWKRAEIWLRFASLFFNPLVLILLSLVLPLGYAGRPVFLYLGWTGLGGIGPFLLAALAHCEAFPRFKDRLFTMPITATIGIGLSFATSFGSLVGLLKQGGEFTTTPKPGQKRKERPSRGVQLSRWLIPLAELILGSYLLFSVWWLWPLYQYLLAPWLIISAAGLWLVGVFSLPVMSKE